MISRLINHLRKPKKGHTLPHIPKNRRIYCVGDIHGRADLLEQLLEKILVDACDYGGKKTVVYLGDYIDRGEQSRQVIDRLLSQALPGFEEIFLLGNHERLMLDFIDDPQVAASWLSFGGRETLTSYGIPLAYIPTSDEVSSLAEQLDRALPDSHREFFKRCADSWQCGSYYFVHAGIRPGIELEKQTLEDQLWIRDEFTESDSNHGVIVVHAHQIFPQPQLLPNRIGIDTGAFSSGVLTCLVLEADEQRLIQTGVA